MYLWVIPWEHFQEHNFQRGQVLEDIGHREARHRNIRFPFHHTFQNWIYALVKSCRQQGHFNGQFVHLVQIHYWCTAPMWKLVKMPIADWLSYPPPLYINIGFGLRIIYDELTSIGRLLAKHQLLRNNHQQWSFDSQYCTTKKSVRKLLAQTTFILDG